MPDTMEHDACATRPPRLMSAYVEEPLLRDRFAGFAWLETSSRYIHGSPGWSRTHDGDDSRQARAWANLMRDL